MRKIDRQRDFTGTKDVTDALRFDAAALEKYLARISKALPAR